MANIYDYVIDGFVKVCEVIEDHNGHWYYKNIDKEILYADHNSWVYFIVKGNEIVKCGESGNPLGIALDKRELHRELQPIKSTASRLGRLRNGDGTDKFIREALRDYVTIEQVSIWARKCEKIQSEITIAGKPHNTKLSVHKDLELDYLRHFVEIDGSLPWLNKGFK